MVTKIKKNEILFYLSYIILYISLFIGDVYNIGGLDILARYLRICSYILIAISCFNLRFVKKEFLQMMVIFMITLLYAMKTGDLYWSILILLIYNSKKINIESVYRISLDKFVLLYDDGKYGYSSKRDGIPEDDKLPKVVVNLTTNEVVSHR